VGRIPPRTTKKALEQYEQMVLDWLDDYEKEKELREKKKELRTRHS